MMDLSREAVTMMSLLSMGVAMAVTMSVCALMVPRRTSPSAMAVAVAVFLSLSRLESLGFLGAKCERLQ